jgi:hypothetical protein
MNWFKSKGGESEADVKCPHCGNTQRVSGNISAVFCKACKKTIYPRKNAAETRPGASAPTSPAGSASKTRPEREPPATKPKGGETQKKPEEKPEEKPAARPAPDAPKYSPSKTGPTAVPSESSGMKRIKCFYCNTVQEVPHIALASFCEKCGQRINLQDYKIKGKFHGELETRGEIRIAAGAEVRANLNVGSAVIDGRISGKITAETRVELNAGGMVAGTVESPVFLVHEGAGFVGNAVIKPIPPKD